MDDFFFPCRNYMDRTIPAPVPMQGPAPKHKLARAYIPDQPYIGLFSPDEGLRKGTIFPNLYVPFPIKSME